MLATLLLSVAFLGVMADILTTPYLERKRLVTARWARTFLLIHGPRLQFSLNFSEGGLSVDGFEGYENYNYD